MQSLLTQDMVSRLADIPRYRSTGRDSQEFKVGRVMKRPQSTFWAILYIFYSYLYREPPLLEMCSTSSHETP